MTILAIFGRVETNEYFFGTEAAFWGLILYYYRTRDKEKAENYELALAEVSGVIQ
jgi:hypothetical protein